jgi:hypothetical protein
MILRMAIESILEWVTGEGSFFLGASGLQLSKHTVDDEGNVTGFIDWDGIDAMPF